MALRPRVSVIIPTHDRRTLLADAIESVLRQESADVEVLVCDDGSTDDTAAFVRSFGDPVRHIAGPRSGRPAVVRNRGLEQAHGEIIAFLDDDDLWEPHKLERQLTVLEAEPAAGFVYCDARLLREDGSISPPVLAGRPAAGGSLVDRLIDDCFIHPSTVLVRRELLVEVGGFDETLPIAEDYDLWLRLAAVARGVLVPEPLVRVRRHGGSHSAGNQRLTYESSALVLERQLARAPLSIRQRLRCRAAVARFHARASAEAFAHRDRAAARSHALWAIRAHPLQREGWRALTRVGRAQRG